jgi:mycobactin polyketide synthetase MbtD
MSLAGRHVLITGGTGALGLEFCEHAARESARRITLVSRSGETSATEARLQPIRARGTTETRVVACDVTDHAEVLRMADQIGDLPVDLLIHAVVDATSAADMELADLTSDTVDLAIRAKVVGIAHVVDAVELAMNSRVLLCSSTASVLGGRAKTVYAAANRMLDAYAQQKRADGVDCVSVQWGQWAVYRGHESSDIENLARLGYLSMRSADAIPLGLGGHAGNVAIAAFDWDRARSMLGALGYGPTLSQLVTSRTEDASAVTAMASGVDLGQRVLRLLADVIGADDLQALDGTVPLVALGLDSLNALHLRRRIKSEFSCEVAVTALLGGATLDDVVRMVQPESSVPAGPAERR